MIPELAGGPHPILPSSGGTKVTIDGQAKDIAGNVVCASVAFGNVNGVTLAVAAGQGDATAQKDDKSYKITGNAVGIDMANPLQPVKKPFELDFTCPEPRRAVHAPNPR